MNEESKYCFQEFFAGGGMVRQALGPNWTCMFANDFDGKKALTYQENWGVGGELIVDDIRNISPDKIGTRSDLAWASFPCQDLSLAGKGKGLNSERSGMFFTFWEKIIDTTQGGPPPKTVVIENVCGTLTSNGGQDFKAIIKTFVLNGYRVGGLIIDAKEFVPQSRKRLFIVGIRNDTSFSPSLISTQPVQNFHTPQLIRAFESLPSRLKSEWLWFNLPRPNYRKTELKDLLEPEATVIWDSEEKTAKILAKMSDINASKVIAAQRLKEPSVGALFLRTRPHKTGKRVFAEVRFDGISGCLRTPNGGSSRQSILWVSGNTIKSRLLTARETARLMGLPESYKLPKNNNAALHLTGDGVVVQVVDHLKTYLLEPIISGLTVSNIQVHEHFKSAE